MTESKLSYPLDCKCSKHRRLNWLGLSVQLRRKRERIFGGSLETEAPNGNGADHAFPWARWQLSETWNAEKMYKCSECVSSDWGSVSTILNWRSQGSTIPWQQVACRDIRMSLLRGLEAQRCLFERLLEFMCLLCVTKTKTIHREIAEQEGRCKGIFNNLSKYLYVSLPIRPVTKP